MQKKASKRTPFIAGKPALRESAEALRARIPGWGADLDPADRPSYPPREQPGIETGAHWDFPERQPEEHHLRSFATLRPDNPVTETGVMSEFSAHGVRSP